MTSTDGLTADEVAARLAAGQGNVTPPQAGRTIGQILRANVLTRFNAILGALFVVVLVVGPAQDGLFGAVLVANTAIGVAQEIRAKRTLDRLRILTAPRARVRRRDAADSTGTATEVPVEQVVVGDVLELRAGDQVPVDAVVLEADGAEIDESLLSGESEPSRKQPGDHVLSGSFVVAGGALAEATAVGAAAYAAGLEARARRFSLVRSELQAGTNTILRMVTWVMVPAGGGLVVSQLLRSHQGLDDALRGSVAGVGAMVPEGLVLLTSVAFAVGAVRLARRRVLVQELAALEGLARVDVLCIDKTGTLTESGMHLSALEPLGGHTADEAREAAAAMAQGDPAPNATTQALAAGLPGSGGWSVEDRVAFSSARKWSAASFAAHGTWVLGAPEILGADLAPEARRAVAGHQEAGERVLLLARAPGTARAGELRHAGSLEAELDPVALLVLAERLRAEAAATVGFLVEQGVTVKVLSGDAPATVGTVARRVGVPDLGMPGDAAAMGDGEDELAAALGATNVLGRVRPEQKVAAVRGLQAGGHVVAMVGDGVNDVQALKQADLGIAMGSGSQSSRSVARIVLLDSSFAAVPRVLDEGRRVIANIERVANLFVTKTVYAAWLAVLLAVAGVPYPFFPRHLTIVSTCTIGVPGFFLALAAGAPRASSRFVRRILDFTVPAGTVAAAATLAVYGVARLMSGVSTTQARTAAMLELFAVALWVLGRVGRPLHPARLALLAAMAGSLPLLFAVPLARRVLALDVPSVELLVVVLVVAVAALVTLGALWWRVPAFALRVAPELPPGTTMSASEPGRSSGNSTRQRPAAADGRVHRHERGAVPHG